MKKVKGILIIFTIVFMVFITTEIQAYSYSFSNNKTLIEEQLEVERREKFNNSLLITSGVLLVYWLILIWKYEKDKKYDIASKDEEMFNKYNPLLAGCIQGNRNVLSRDIIAVILDLVNKKYLKIDIIKNESKVLNENYKIIVEVNEHTNYKPDEIETFIIKWLYKVERNWKDKGSDEISYSTNTENIPIGEKIDLIKALKSLPKKSYSKSTFKKLSDIVTEKLNKLGANKAKVPQAIRAVNAYIFVVTIFLLIFSIKDFNFYNLDNMINVLLLALYIFINLLMIFRRFIHKITRKVIDKKIIITSISVILMSVIVMILTAIFIENKYLLVNELLICIGTLIMLTDNLMLKNDPIMAEDYSRLNALKHKIEEYSMMEEREIKEIVLWERYLSYAISFGISNKITDKIKTIINDEDMIKMFENDLFFNYVKNDYDYLDSEIRKSFIQDIKNDKM